MKDHPQLPDDEQEIEALLLKQAPKFKATSPVNLESDILKNIKQHSPLTTKRKSTFEWKFITSAALILLGVSFLFYKNNQVISQSEYKDDSISLIQLIQENMDSINTEDFDQQKMAQNLLAPLSVTAIFEDLALLTYQPEQK